MINKKSINYAATKPSRNIRWGVPFQWRCKPKAYNFPKKIPPHKRHEEGHLCRTSFVGAFVREIILKPKLVNITIESENKNYISFGKPFVFKIKSFIESKNYSLLFEKWILSLQLMSACTKPTLERLFTYFLALINRFNLAFVKSMRAFTPFYNSFLFL